MNWCPLLPWDKRARRRHVTLSHPPPTTSCAGIPGGAGGVINWCALLPWHKRALRFVSCRVTLPHLAGIPGGAGGVAPREAGLAAHGAQRDAALSHRGESALSGVLPVRLGSIISPPHALHLHKCSTRYFLPRFTRVLWSRWSRNLKIAISVQAPRLWRLNILFFNCSAFITFF